MPDPFIVGGAVTAYLAKDGLNKLLGPTAEYLGEELKEFTRKRKEKIVKVFQIAERRLGSDIEKPGRVSPKVLREVINEASFCDDELSLEYFGGVLASARTEISRDDRGARFARLTSDLSSYQVRAHFLIYSSASNIFRGERSFKATAIEKFAIFFPLESFSTAMDFSEPELLQFANILGHIAHGLAAAQLIAANWQVGKNLIVSSGGESRSGAGLKFSPSAIGAELFLWAHGCGHREQSFLFSDEIASVVDQELAHQAGGVAVHGMRKRE